jgi:hypothetical protein
MQGGNEFLDSYPLRRVTPEHIEWIKSRPYYIDLPEEGRGPNGRTLFLSHTGFAPVNDSHELEVGSKRFNELVDIDNLPFGKIDKSPLWHRGTPAKLKDRFHIFGHTPTKKAIVTDYYANIDTGAAYKHRGYGNLTAIHWPSLELIVQPTIED